MGEQMEYKYFQCFNPESKYCAFQIWLKLLQALQNYMLEHTHNTLYIYRYLNIKMLDKTFRTLLINYKFFVKPLI